MAINVTKETSEAIQTLVHDAFDTNAILDRAKTVMTTTFAFPIFADYIHKLAHKYSLDMGDGIGDLLEKYNEPINYGDIPTHIEEYESVSDIIDNVYNVVIIFQNELNQVAKIALDNMDIHIYKGLLDIIDKHNLYVEQVIIWKDLVELYKDIPTLDVHSKEYDIIGG